MRGITRNRYAERKKNMKIKDAFLGLTLLTVSACGGNEAAQRNEDGQCPKLSSGTYAYQGHIFGGTCGVNESEDGYTFVDMENVDPKVRDLKGVKGIECTVDASWEYEGLQFAGTYDIIDDKSFRFTGTINTGSCTANAEFLYKKN
jgi:hypothetical protein